MHLPSSDIVTRIASFFHDPRNTAICFFAATICLGVYTCTSRARLMLRLNPSLRVDLLSDTIIIVPLDKWSSVTKRGLSLALQLTGKVRVLHVDSEEKCEEFRSLWQRNVVGPLMSAGRRVPELILLKAPKTYTTSPMTDYILAVEREDPNRQVVVVVPQLAVRHWWQRPFHNYRIRLLKFVLSTQGSQRLMVIDVPWYL